MIMKKLWYMILGTIMLACNKEDALDSRIQLENLYTISDDASDTIKQQIYRIYTTYDVPVYFNDTIGQVFLKTDVNGNAVYKYENLDLAWTFDDYEQLNYYYHYVTEPQKQSEALHFIEQYLKDASPELYPFCFFVTERIDRKKRSEIKLTEVEDQFLIGFRTITLLLGRCTEEEPKSIAIKMLRSNVSQKINNYAEELAYFHAVSEEKCYNAYWTNLDPTLSEYWKAPELDPDYINTNYTPEQLEEIRAQQRPVVAHYGFVMAEKQDGGMSAPRNKEEDLQGYIKVIMNGSDETFRANWGNYPLVMKKYEILYKIITEKLGVEL